MDALEKYWFTLLAHYTDNQEHQLQLWHELVKSYSHKKRYYHNLSHLDYMLKKVQIFKSSLHNTHTLFFSIFYHDFIYDVKRKDNERRSAIVAKKRLTNLGVPQSIIESCYELILATKIHSTTNDKTQQLLLDADLGILGESAELYQAYAQQIRREYSIYPNFLYNKGRRKMLRYFLDKPHIYQTTFFQQSHEEQAKANLAWELGALT